MKKKGQRKGKGDLLEKLERLEEELKRLEDET